MKNFPIITICTQVYNTADYLPQCIESVLNQTYQKFEYIIVDNGSTDGSQDILQNYAEKGNQIKLIRFDENKNTPRILEVVYNIGKGKYLAFLDSDDWWESVYLEHMLAFAEKNRLDIACTGTMMHIMATGAQSARKIDQPMILSRELFAQALPWYHVFFRPVWGKLIRMECLKAVPLKAVPALPYGTDTLWCFQLLRRANRIGIDSSALHHYRIFNKSVSYQYDPMRFQSDVYLYNDAIDFLKDFGPVSIQNRNFLQCVYVNAVTDTVNVIHDSALSPAEKLREYRRIAEHSITRDAYRDCTYDAAGNSRKNLLLASLSAGAALGTENDENLRFVMQTLLPRCGQAVSSLNVKMFLEDPKILTVLFQDNPEDLLQNLLARMKQNQGVKKYSVPAAIQALAVNNPFLCWIDDAVFLRKYAEIYRMVWQDEKAAALEEMAGLLLNNQVNGARETFLKLFLSLAAALEQPSAFIYGKLQLGKLYLRQNRASECRAIVADLEEMGLENNGELQALNRGLKEL